MAGLVSSPDGMRILPAAPPQAYQTFSIHRPLATHWRNASCREVQCPQYVNGWKVRVELLSPEGLFNATHCGRKFQRVQVGPGETWLIYEAGQPCFQSETHRKQVDRPEIYVARRGDWRAQGDPQRLSCASWLDWFGENQEVLHDMEKRG